MGNIYRLSEKSSCFEATLKLIEKSFQYKTPNSFKTDFAPLIDESNFHNCFILLDENEKVVAHVGVKEKTITLKGRKYPVTLLGGIAVDEARRGEGHFQTLFQDVLAEKRSDSTFFLLWSDMEKLYNKFGFYLCGTQFEFTKYKEESPFIKTKLNSLSVKEKKEIQHLYNSSFAKTYLTLDRTDADWEMIEKITSSDLYLLKKKDLITDYYFMNKGQDLPGIIYEYGTTNEIKSFIEKIGSYGKVWTGTDFSVTEDLQYQFFLGPADLRLFSDFVFNLTNEKLAIRNINLMKQEVYFDFNDETLSLETSDFLRGILGPGIFEELEVPAIFLSGLESV